MHKIVILPCFRKQAKELNKKFKNLGDDLSLALESFDKENHLSLGNSIYKMRINSSELTKGKSGGFRLIILLVELNNTIYPIALYHKSVRENISKKELKDQMKVVREEILEYKQ